MNFQRNAFIYKGLRYVVLLVFQVLQVPFEMFFFFICVGFLLMQCSTDRLRRPTEVTVAENE